MSVTPEQISDMNAALFGGLNAFAARAVGRAASRELAWARLQAVTVDPDMIEALVTLVAAGSSPSQVRRFAADAEIGRQES